MMNLFENLQIMKEYNSTHVDEEDSGLKVCRHCLDAIISREGRQNVVNTYTHYDWDEDAEPLICDWCEDETDELYEIDNTKEGSDFYEFI